jgi:hypothetical protein
MRQASATGLEPATTGSTVRYSSQLSYAPVRSYTQNSIRCRELVKRTVEAPSDSSMTSRIEKDDRQECPPYHGGP